MTKYGKSALSMLAIALLVITTSGCSIMSRADCIEADWRSAGYNDATRGHTSSRLTPRINACAKHGQPANKIAYQLGYKEGLAGYCTAERALYEGSRNGDYRGICPADTEVAFVRQYINGLQIARNDVTQRFFWLENDLFSARFHRTTSDNDDHVKRLERRIHRLDNRLDHLRSTRFQINRKIALWTARLEAN